MSSAEDQADALARRAGAVTDPKLRVAYVRHELQQMDLGSVADVVLVAAARAEAHNEQYRTLMLAISLALADPAATAMRRRIVDTAAARGQHQVRRLLDDRKEGEEEDNHPVPDFGRGRPLTLGERKALARRSDRQLLGRVLRDPHPSVISVLLSNPVITEDDIVQLCARRPIPSEVLREVFRSPRWVLRYRVRRAIVRNPYCPLDVALQLTAHLNAQDAQQVADSPELPAEVRRACRRMASDELMH